MFFYIYKGLPFILSADKTHIHPCSLSATKIKPDRKKLKIPADVADLKTLDEAKRSLGIFLVDGLDPKTDKIVKVSNKVVSSIDHDMLKKMVTYIKPRTNTEATELDNELDLDIPTDSLPTAQENDLPE